MHCYKVKAAIHNYPEYLNAAIEIVLTLATKQLFNSLSA